MPLSSIKPHFTKVHKWLSSDISFWAGIQLVLGLLPTWFILISKIYRHQDLTLSDYVMHGEFALYTTSIITTVFFLASRNYKKPTFPYRPMFILIGLAFTLFSSFIYLDLSSGIKGQISDVMIAFITITIFVLSMIACMLAMHFEKNMVTVHPVGHSFGVGESVRWAARVAPRNSSVLRPCSRKV
ncbi:hypothetical protein BH11PLA2_BH11PLA2_52170 [soil metagenome]